MALAAPVPGGRATAAAPQCGRGGSTADGLPGRGARAAQGRRAARVAELRGPRRPGRRPGGAGTCDRGTSRAPDERRTLHVARHRRRTGGRRLAMGGMGPSARSAAMSARGYAALQEATRLRGPCRGRHRETWPSGSRLWPPPRRPASSWARRRPRATEAGRGRAHGDPRREGGGQGGRPRRAGRPPPARPTRRYPRHPVR